METNIPMTIAFVLGGIIFGLGVVFVVKSLAGGSSEAGEDLIATELKRTRAELDKKELLISEKERERQRLENEDRALKEKLRDADLESKEEKRSLEDAVKDLRSALDDKAEEVSAKNLEIAELGRRIADVDKEHVKIEERMSRFDKSELEAIEIKKEVDTSKAEAARLKDELSAKSKEDEIDKQEIEKLKAQLVDAENKYTEFEEELGDLIKAELDLDGIKKAADEQKAFSHNLKQRIEESKVKMRLLEQKAKENMELIAKFTEDNSSK